MPRTDGRCSTTAPTTRRRDDEVSAPTGVGAQARRRDSDSDAGDVIRVQGVDVPRGAIAELALRLTRAGELGLANHFGRAIDRHLDEIDLWQRDFDKILGVTATQPIPGLEPLLEVMRKAP